MSLLLNIRASNKVYVCMYVTTSIINGRNVFAVIVYFSTGQVVKNKVHVQLLQSFVFNETGGIVNRTVSELAHSAQRYLIVRQQ